MSLWKYGEWFADKGDALYRWNNSSSWIPTARPADSWAVEGVPGVNEALTNEKGQEVIPQDFRDVFTHQGDGGNFTETWIFRITGRPGENAPQLFYDVRSALVDLHGYMGPLSIQALDIDQTHESIADADEMTSIKDETINTFLGLKKDGEEFPTTAPTADRPERIKIKESLLKFFESFYIHPNSILPGANETQTLEKLFKYRLALQVRRKFAKAATGGEVETVSKAEWAAIRKYPMILSNELMLKVLQGPVDIADEVLGFMPLWQTLVQLGLFPKKLDEEVTMLLKQMGGGLGDDPTSKNVKFLWIPEPGRTGGDAKHTTNPNDTATDIKADNMRFQTEMSVEGVNNIKFSGKGAQPRHGRTNLFAWLQSQRYCPRFYNDQLATPRGRAITASEMLLPMRDSIDQTKSFFTEDLVSVASLKMKKYEGDIDTIEYIKNAETELGLDIKDGGFFGGQWYASFGDSDVDVYDDPGTLANLLSKAYKKFLIDTVGVSDLSAGRPTLVTSFTDTVNNVALKIYPIILQNIENAFRVAMWKVMISVKNDDPECPFDSDVEVPDEDEIEEAANDALKKNKDPKLEATLVEDDFSKGIEGRQKFFKQCALMRNLTRLKGEFIRRVENDVKSSRGKPFDGRFFMAKSLSDQGKIINNLVSSKHSAMFFEIPPSVLSYLMPKIKLFRVYDDNGIIKETEFIFPQSTDIDKQKNFTNIEAGSTKSFLSSTFDKGDGVGLKDFSFSFNGTNPAESRNDITANLTLFFQSFGDFVKERVSSDGNTYKFVDLVIQPVKKDRIKIPIIHANQYDPSFYRIRAEIGYINSYEDLSKLSIPGFDTDALKALSSAILNTNKSYYLNMVDHDITVNPDGSVEIKISYRAYIESALKSPRFDALATPEIIKKKRQNNKNLQDLLATGKCSQQKLSEFKANIDAQEIILRKRALQSIIRRLFDRKKIYNCKISTADAEHFREKGFFKTCRLQPTYTATPPSGTGGSSTTDFILSSIGVPDVDDFDFTNVDDTVIQYFFFGDLLYTIMDSMYTKVNGKVSQPGAEQMSIILGSFDLDAFGVEVKGVNVAEIPISVDYFMSWYVDNVLVKGNTRKTFPILDFIRNLSNKLLQKTMLDSCSNVALVNNLRFHTGQLMAYSEDGKNPLKKIVGWNGARHNLFVMCDGADKSNFLPLKGDSSSVAKVSNFFNYMFLNVVGSNLTYTGRGKYEDDIDDGRFHINIGSNRGIVKTISFAKTDIEYIREARMFQNGIDGLLQLSNVYTATVEMFGNTIFYPGMELYINPYGIGGTIMGSPTQGRDHSTGASIANKLGFGGYHTIVGVDSTIAPGKFSTTVRAQWYYAGDGMTPANRNGSVASHEEGTIDPLSGSDDNLPGGFCSNAVVLMENDMVALLEGQETEFKISDGVPDDVEAVFDGDEVDPTDFDGDPVEEIPVGTGASVPETRGTKAVDDSSALISGQDELNEDFYDPWDITNYFYVKGDLSGRSGIIIGEEEEDGMFIDSETMGWIVYLPRAEGTFDIEWWTATNEVGVWKTKNNTAAFLKELLDRALAENWAIFRLPGDVIPGFNQ